MPLPRSALHLALAFGLCLALAGGLFVGLYVVEGVIARIGEADQSPLFWYLPILFLGLFAFTGGCLLAAFAWLRLKKK